jgi:hypothetical protein
VLKYAAATISRTRPITRESAVAIEKIAVLRATRPGWPSGVAGSRAGVLALNAAIVRAEAV